MPAEILQIMRPEITSTIERLNKRRFLPDPIAGGHFSKIVSVMSSAYKRHGYIIERAILEQLKLCPNFDVWRDDTFMVSAMADQIVAQGMNNPAALQGTETAYQEGHRTLQVDAIVFNKETRHLSAYEIKRGAGKHDSGKTRQILRDVLCVQVLLKAYGISRGFDVQTSSSHVIFYYGICSLRPPYRLTKNDLDEHFGWAVAADVEEVNGYYKEQLYAILAG